jgi:flavin reductase
MSQIAFDEDRKRKFRNSMSRHGVSVSVVTTRFEGKPFGFTATAVCSVSDSPPTLLVCINRSSSCFGAFAKAQYFNVNVLMPAQESVSNAFGGSKSHEERFDHGVWTDGTHGAPVLAGAAVSFECELTRSIDEASHSILLGLVLDMHENDEQGTLLYYQRRYVGL